MAFDPDSYLKEKQGAFDPDAYLKDAGIETSVEYADWGTAIKQKLVEASNAADSAISLPAGALASLFDQEAGDKIFRELEERKKAALKAANPNNLKLTTTQQVGGTIATLPAQILGMLGAPAEKGMDLVSRGEDLKTAIGSTIVDTAANTAGVAPMMAAKTLLGRAAIGAGANVAFGAGSDAATQLLAKQKETKEAYNPYDLDKRIVEAVVGGALQGTFGERPVTPKSTNKVVELLKKEQESRDAAKQRQADVPQAQPTEIPNLKATEGFNRQMALFDIPEEGRMPNPYEAVTGDWRIDENGIPIKADLSMEARNLEQPLQRNLWGDELPPKHPQENPVPLTQAIDNIPDTPFKGDAREIALARLTGDIEAPGQLKAAVAEAGRQSDIAAGRHPYELGGEITLNSGIPLTKADLAKMKQDLQKLIQSGILKRVGEGMRGMRVYRAVAEGEDINGPRAGGVWVTPNRDIALNVYAKGDPSKVVEDYIPVKDLYEVHPDGWIYAPEGTDVMNIKRTATMTLGDLLAQKQSAKVPFNFKKQGGGLLVSPKEKTSLDNATIKASSDGTLIPENPKAAEVIEKALQEKDGRLFTYLQSGATSAAMKTGSTLIKAASEIVQNALKRTEKAIREFVFPAEKALRDLKRKDLETLAEIFKEEMFSGKRFDADLLQKALNSKQLEAYVALRDLFDDTLAAQNATRVAKGLPPITAEEAYISSRWTGDFRRPVYNKDGKLVWYLASNSRLGLEYQTRALKAKFPDLVTDPKKDHIVKSSIGKTDLQSAYSTMLDILGRDDPAVQKIKEAIKEQLAAEAEITLAQTKHFEKKHNIRGFVGDRPGHGGVREALAFFEQQIQYAKNAYRWSEMQKAADDLKVLLSDERLQESQPNNIKYIREYFKNALGLGEAKAIRQINDATRGGLGVSPKLFETAIGNVKSFFILQKLAVSAGYTIANFVQASNVIPYLVDLHSQGYKGNPASAIAFGAPTGLLMTMAHYIKSLGGEYLDTITDPFIANAVKYAEDNGVTSRSIYDEGPISSSFTGVGRVAELLGKTMTAPEVFVRSVAFMTFAKMLKDSGKFSDEKALFQKAEELVNKSMVDYRETERPLIFNKLGAAGNFLNTLQTFPISFYNQYLYMAKRAKDGNPVPLAAMLAIHGLAAGVAGIPYSEDLYQLYMFLKDNATPTGLWADLQESPFFSDPKVWMIDTLGQSAVYGWLSDNTGLGLSSRIAAPSMVAMLQSPIGPIKDLAGQVGAVGKAILDPTNSTKAAQAAIKVVPTGLQGLLETSGIMKDHTFVEKPDGSVVALKTSDLADREGIYQRTPEEIAARKWGLRSQKEVLTKDLTYSVERAERERNERSSLLVKEYYDAIRRGNTKEAERLNKLYIRLTGSQTGISDPQLEKQIIDEFIDKKTRLLMKETTSPSKLIEIVRMKKILDKELSK